MLRGSSQVSHLFIDIPLTVEPRGGNLLHKCYTCEEPFARMQRIGGGSPIDL